MNRFIKLFLVSVVLVLFLMPVNTKAQFEVDKNHLGYSLGFYFHGSSVMFGANYEYGM